MRGEGGKYGVGVCEAACECVYGGCVISPCVVIWSTYDPYDIFNQKIGSRRIGADRVRLHYKT